MTRVIYKFRFLPLVMVAVLAAVSPMAAQAATAPSLGSAGNFAVLSAAPNGGGAVTCTDSTINGNVGSSGTSASVVQTSCLITGSLIAPVSAQVVTDFNRAYAAYAAIPCTGTLNTAYTGASLSLASGVYCTAAAVTFTDTTLTLTGSGPWIFKIGTGGTGALTGTNFTVVTSNPCNVNWWVAQAATMTTSGFAGTILAGAAITATGLAGTATPFHGNALAKAAVTITDVTLVPCPGGKGHEGKEKEHCNQGVGNGPEGCDPGNSNNKNTSNDELGGTPGDPGRQGRKSSDVARTAINATSTGTSNVTSNATNHDMSNAAANATSKVGKAAGKGTGKSNGKNK